MHEPRTILVTGGAGFIGSHFIRWVFRNTGFTGRIVNFDKLTYAGNPHNLDDVVAEWGPRYSFVRGDIADEAEVDAALREYEVDTIVHLAAESHVDRSIDGPKEFVRTNILGTFTLLQGALRAWGDRRDVRFHHVSTDEVFGSLGQTGAFVETTPYDPRSPYSATKASSDHLVRAWHHTYGLPVTLSNCSNNYGPFHFPEKLIPLILGNLLARKPLPVYGDGSQVRDWLYVEDHAAALWTIVTRGKTGDSYNVGGGNEWSNLRLVEFLCDRMAAALGADPGEFRRLITHVKDRPGHDQRYAIDARKLREELGWAPRVTFAQGLETTLRWYLDHQDWVAQVSRGDHQAWVEAHYGKRT